MAVRAVLALTWWLGKAQLNPAQPRGGADRGHPFQDLDPAAIAGLELCDLCCAVGVGRGHQDVGADHLDQAPPFLVQVLERDEADTTLMGDHAQPLQLRDSGTMRALARADLVVAIEADDEEITEPPVRTTLRPRVRRAPTIVAIRS